MLSSNSINVNNDSDEQSDDFKLIALVNGASGAKKGKNLVKELKKYKFCVYNVKDIANSALIREKLANDLYKFQKNCAVVICGGDGTNVWATSLIDDCISASDKHIRMPPIACLPFGTGNDLSRTLGWGNIEPKRQILDSISDIVYAAKIKQRWSYMDRWSVSCTVNDSEKKLIQKSGQQMPSTFLCYLSIGYDAEVTYNVEQERRNHPERFKHQILNQTKYVKHSLKHVFKPSSPITNLINVYVDGKKAKLPQNCRSLKLVNINSAANGIFFWGNGASKNTEYQQQHSPRLDDGLIEVMATEGPLNLLKCRSKMEHAQRISQSKEIVIEFKHIPAEGMHLQLDGEAFVIDEKCRLKVSVCDKIPTVIGFDDPRGVEDWLIRELDDKELKKSKQVFKESFKNDILAHSVL